MTPSELLQAAADRLRYLAAEAVDGPWRQHDTHLTAGGHTATVMRGEGNGVELVAWLPTWNHEPWDNSRKSFTTARWIAALSPALSPMLEEILRQAAFAYELEQPNTQDENVLNLARALVPDLAGVQPQEET